MKYLLITLTCLFTPAHALPLLSGTTFNDQDCSNIIMQLDHSQTADSFAVAARCTLVDAMTRPDFSPPEAVLLKAEAFARQAVEKDPSHIEGRLQLAISLSLRARPLSTRAAMRSGLGDEAKALAVSVLEDDPDNYYAHGFMAVWNIEVVRRGGSVGSAVMGASVKKAHKHYKAALTSNAADVPTHWQYARALAALNAKKYRDEIKAALDATINVETTGVLDLVMQERAKTLSNALATQKRRNVEALAERML
ncbi:MAG: hypothetical protein AAGH90_11575 [Pseudomonadota bacterium]